MKRFSTRIIICVLGLLPLAPCPLLAQGASSHASHIPDVKLPLADLTRDGVFGFPQAQAQVLCDVPELRFSVWNNGEYLYAQAIVWNDDDSAPGQLPDGREIGDRSDLTLDLDADGQRTKDVDRVYMLNPWPNETGLRYQIVRGPNSWTAILSDSKGRGAIRYVETPEGRRIRVDSYVIPLKEISRQVGEKIRLVYYAASPHPDITVNSVGFDPGHPYYSYNIPMGGYHDYFLIKGAELSISNVPDGRHDAPSATPRRR